METVRRVMHLVKQYEHGVLTHPELRAELIEVIQDDRKEIIQATLNGTLSTVRSDGM